jgi:hypothetical protein
MAENQSPTMRVRPFTKVIESPVSGARLPCSGIVEGQTFILRVGNGVHRIDAQVVGADQWGDFAVVPPSRTELEGGFGLEVEEELSTDPEFEPLPGCVIRIVRRPEQEAVDGAARARGFDPSAVNVLIAPEAVLSFSFHAEGQLTGWGGTADFPNRNPTTAH